MHEAGLNTSSSPDELTAAQSLRDAISARSDEIEAAKQLPADLLADLNANDIEMATRIIEGSARSMRLDVVEG